MYNYLQQGLESVRDGGLSLRHALGLHGDNMTENGVRGMIAER